MLELPIASVGERPLRRPGQRGWKVGFLLRIHGSPLPDNPERHVGHVWICYQPGPLQFDMFGSEVIEQPHAVAQQHGDNIYVYFVQQPRSETLLDEARCAHRDVLLTSRRPGLFDRALHAICDEGERRPLVVPSVGGGMGYYEDGDVFAYGMSAAPTVRDVERPPSRHYSSNGGEHLVQHLCGLGRDLERHPATRRDEIGVAAGVPVEESHSSLTERMVGPVVRPGDEPVQRHRESRSYFAHVCSPSNSRYWRVF